MRDSQRERNFHHMLRYPQDRQWLQGEDAGRVFLEAYAHELERGLRRPRPHLLSALERLLG